MTDLGFKFKASLMLSEILFYRQFLIIDDQNRPMFEMGSAVLQTYTVEILRAIGNTLNQVPNKIGLSGHTDATPYQGATWATPIGSFRQTAQTLPAAN